MPRNPLPPIDRLFATEFGVAEIQREIASRARRRPQVSTFLQAWPAETRERYSEGDGYSYPAPDDDDADQLPVVTLQPRISSGVLTWLERSEHPVITAVSPVGWLPPFTRIEIAFDGQQYRVVRVPAMMHGKVAEGGLTGGACGEGGYGGADQYALGHGTVHVYTESTPGVMVPQWYQDAEPVEMTVYNPGDPVPMGDCVSFVLDRHNRWVRVFAAQTLVGGCLIDNHPGRGIAFGIYLGKWDAASEAWIYDTDLAYVAIDWRYGVPYPGAGATGLFQARQSQTYDWIYEVVALDCSSPGECGD